MHSISLAYYISSYLFIYLFICQFISIYLPRLWLNTAGNRATGNILKDALTACGRQDIIDACALELADVTDKEEIDRATLELGQVWINR